jgi:hypothetical protein
MADLNLDLDYFTHPKTVRLIGLLGKGAEVLPIRLWCYCGKYHAEDGKFTGYSTQEIESIVSWWGKEGEFVQALLKVRFLEGSEGAYSCHDWAEHNGHIQALKERNRKVAEARWDKIRKGNTSGVPSGIPKDTSGVPQPTDHLSKPDQPERTEPPTPLDLLNDRMDLETFIRIWWGAKEGNLPYPILVQMVQLGNQYGKDKLGEAIIQAARQNVRRFAYVQGILRPKGGESPVDRAAPRTAKSTAVGEFIPSVMKHPCVAHPETLVGDDDLCPKCFPMCGKCGFQHAADESCDEWKTRLDAIKKTIQ